MAEKNHKNFIMVFFHMRLESSSDLTVLSSLHIVTSLLLQAFKQRLINITLFSLTISFVLILFHSNALIILVLFLHIIWITEFTTPNYRHTSTFLFPFAICCIT